MDDKNKLVHIAPGQLKDILISLCEKAKGVFVTKSSFKTEINQITNTNINFESRIAALEETISKLQDAVEIRYDDDIQPEQPSEESDE